MMHQGKFAYSEQREYFKNIFQELGHPAIDLVVLEWNIGPMVSGTELPSEAEVALMVSEQFTQFIQSGLPMACFWPLTWPGSPAWANRILINTTEGYSPNKVYNMFALYTDVLGQMKVKSSASAERLINVAVKSQDGNTVWVYLINKNLDKPTVEVNLALEDFKAKDYSAIGFESTDITDGPLAVKDIIIKQRGDTIYSLTMPQFSLAKITLKR